MKTTCRNILAISLGLTLSNALGAGLSNGSFESPALPGIAANFNFTPVGFDWTLASGDFEILAAAYWQPSSGLQSIDLNGATTGSIYQDFTFSSSGTWAIRFDLSANPDAGSQGDGFGSGIKNVRVDFGIPGLMTTLGIFGVAADPRSIFDMQYVTITTPSVDVSDSVVYRLQFTSLVPGNGGAVLDNVQLVPEPSALSLLSSGLAGCLFLYRRKARQS